MSIGRRARRLGARKTVTVGLIGRRTPPTHTAGAVPGHCCEPRSADNHKILGLRLPVAHFRNVRRERVCPSGAARRLGARKTVTVGLIGRRTPPTHTAGAVPGHCCEPRSADNHKILGLPESSAYPVRAISEAEAMLTS
jgi:hypothetical protein